MEPYIKKERKKPTHQFMTEFIQLHPELKDYHEGYEAYNQSDNPKAGKGMFGEMWKRLKGTARPVKQSPLEKNEAYYEVIRELNVEQERLQRIVNDLHISALLTDNLEERKTLREKENKAIDAMFNANHKIRKFMETRVEEPTTI